MDFMLSRPDSSGYDSSSTVPGGIFCPKIAAKDDEEDGDTSVAMLHTYRVIKDTMLDVLSVLDPAKSLTFLELGDRIRRNEHLKHRVGTVFIGLHCINLSEKGLPMPSQITYEKGIWSRAIPKGFCKPSKPRTTATTSLALEGGNPDEEDDQPLSARKKMMLVVTASSALLQDSLPQLMHPGSVASLVDEIKRNLKEEHLLKDRHTIIIFDGLFQLTTKKRINKPERKDFELKPTWEYGKEHIRRFYEAKGETCRSSIQSFAKVKQFVDFMAASPSSFGASSSSRPAVPPPTSARGPADPSKRFAQFAAVTIHGLQSAASQKYNFANATVEEWNAAQGRYLTRIIEGPYRGEKLAVRPECLMQRSLA